MLEKLSVNLPMRGMLGRAWEWGVDGATETVEVVYSFRSHQLIEGSRVDCTVCITDHNVAFRTARNKVGYYCNRIQWDNVGTILPLTFRWRDPSLTDNIPQSNAHSAVRSQHNWRRYHSGKMCSELFHFDIFRNVYKKLPWIPLLVDCTVTKWLWVVLRTTGCWRTSILTQKVDSPWTKMKTTIPGWNSGITVGRNRCLVLLLCAGRPVLPMAALLAQTG